MDTKSLENFAQSARRQLQEQVAAKLAYVLTADTPTLRAQSEAINALNSQVAQTSRQAVVEQVAYTWFNRFCALRYMDVNHYTDIKAVSPSDEKQFTQPELLQEAKNGHIDPELKVDQRHIFALLAGQATASNPQAEAYRLLLVAVCNHYHQTMPFMFEPINHYTELLLPDDLLSEGSVLHGLRQTLTAEVCQDVEVIGWLYQYYISEKKDAVIKSKKKIEADEIPAATQLFTPHWIVRYLVQNSLGRLWLLNHPHSKLAEQMEFYIPPTSPETDFLTVSSPEELTICDPAVGSGHMLTYAFDLLFAIYEEQGHMANKIPSLILQHNLFGLEIDSRAAALAAFALMMKARAHDRRFFRRGILPHITLLKPMSWQKGELDQQKWLTALPDDQRTRATHDLTMWQEADQLGALLRPQLTEGEVQTLLTRLTEDTTTLNPQPSLFGEPTPVKAQQALEQTLPLARAYHVVVANPPFMNSKNMNPVLKKFMKSNYSDYKTDLFSAFMVRNFELSKSKGYLGYVTPFVWMFLSSYEKLRAFLLSEKMICNLVKPSYTSFFASAIVPLVTFVTKNDSEPERSAEYIDLGYLGSAESQPIKLKEAIADPECGYFYRATAQDLQKIPGSPIAYWLSKEMRKVFQVADLLGDISKMRVGLQTGDNLRFLREWQEVELDRIGFSFTSKDFAKESKRKWFPYNKGGDYRKWYGNQTFVVNWFNDGHEIKNFRASNGKLRSRPQNVDYYFRDCLTYTSTSSSYFGVRYSPSGFIFDVKGSSCFAPSQNLPTLLGFLASKLVTLLLNALNPSIEFQTSNLASLPFKADLLDNEDLKSCVMKLISLSQTDWDNYETSWEFTTFPLLDPTHRGATLADTYQTLRAHWQRQTAEMQRLEEENNRLFIEAYGLQEELTPDVPLKEITLTCNPHYRYGGKLTNPKREARLQTDTIKELVSYAVGCMFGRYALEKPGLILANAGETAADYHTHIPNPSFPADPDNVIPIIGDDWFPDDIGARFRHFLRLTFGAETLADNLAFVETALGRDIDSYFQRDFYKDHLQTYNKRPIYWLFASPKGSFRALIYLHRYRPDTASVVLNNYLRPYQGKLQARKTLLQTVSADAGASQREQTNALKEIAQIDKTLRELSEYESDTLYPLATRQIPLDLDDGVKVNYKKLGNALQKVAGLS